MGKFQPSRTWSSKFRFALRGLLQGVRDQTSFRIHLPVAIAVIGAAVVLRLSIERVAILILAIGLVIVGELGNSGLEHLAAAVSEEHDVRIERALDVAAGAVLAASLVAVAVGVCILGPPLIEWLNPGVLGTANH